MRPDEVIVEEWIRESYSSMGSRCLNPGNDSGLAALGVMIIFDGYGHNEEKNIQDDLKRTTRDWFTGRCRKVVLLPLR